MPYSPQQTKFAQGEHAGRALDRWWFLCIYGFYIYIVGLFFFVLLMVKWFSIFFFFFFKLLFQLFVIIGLSTLLE